MAGAGGTKNEADDPADGDTRSGTGGRAFQIVAGVVMAILLIVFVIQPALARGGFGELLIIAGIFAAVLLIERWLRTR